LKSPEAKAWTWLVASSVIIGIVLFLSAGTIRYWQAWFYLAVTVVCSVPVTLFMIRRPALLERRTKFGEQRPTQRIIVLSLLMVTDVAFIFPGLDRRFDWCAIVFFMAMSLALGSYWGLIPAILTIPCFAWRLHDEEAFLAQNLPGYREYCHRVRWHLIPGIY
jgi:hypothetical protein